MQTVHDHLGLTVAVAVLAGLFIGSFLNVVVYRTPRHLSVAKPRSFCPACGRQLAAWENIPVVSWIALRGRCHGCGCRISLRYPLVEVATGAVFGLVTLAWQATGPAVGFCVLGATALAIALIDLGDLRAPLAVAGVGTAIGDSTLIAAFAWDGRWELLVGAQVGALVGSAALVVLRRRDPACDRPLGIGRTSLVVAGCWLGGLGALPAISGLGAAGLTFAAGLGVLRFGHRGDIGSTGRRRVSWAGGSRLVHRPLIPAVAVGMAVGLLVFA